MILIEYKSIFSYDSIGGKINITYQHRNRMRRSRNRISSALRCRLQLYRNDADPLKLPQHYLGLDPVTVPDPVITADLLMDPVTTADPLMDLDTTADPLMDPVTAEDLVMDPVTAADPLMNTVTTAVPLMDPATTVQQIH
jgi:hypothetical protein